jgi:hypothetical protein
MTPINATPPTISLPALGAETAGIIHDNLGIVLTYAFSKPALEEYRGWLMGQRCDTLCPFSRPHPPKKT